MKFLYWCLTLLPLSLFAIDPSPALKFQMKRVESDLNLKNYLRDFPFSDYKLTTIEGLGMLYLDEIHDNVKDQLRRGIYWEEGIADRIREHTKEGSVAIDFGSHIGIHTLTMSHCVGPSGIVVSFEPQRKLYREQHHNLLANHCRGNVFQLPYCAGKQEGWVEIVPWKGEGINEGGASIGKGGEQAYMITCDSLNLRQVSCIKIDVEGHELPVLEGAFRTILTSRPVIIFEILGNHNLDTCTGEILKQYHKTLDFLKHLGYRIERIANTNDFIAYPGDIR